MLEESWDSWMLPSVVLVVLVVVVPASEEAGPSLAGQILTSPVIPKTSRVSLMGGHSQQRYTADPHFGNNKVFSLASLQRRGRRGPQRGGPGEPDRKASLPSATLAVAGQSVMSVFFDRLAALEQSEQDQLTLAEREVSEVLMAELGLSS